VWRSRHRQWIDKWAEENRQRHERWLVEWRERVATEAREQKLRFDKIDAAMENDKRVTRDMLLELREGRAMLRDLRHGIQSNTEGLLRVLDRLDRSDEAGA
jgi:hypothetical protein